MSSRAAVSAAAVDSLVSAGAKSAASPAAVAQLADTVITMLPSSPHVRSVLAGDGGVIAAAKAGSLLIDCSTIDPGTTREVAKIAGSKGVRLPRSCCSPPFPLPARI
jgi:3-hydroxyisobutyrate dehydrogenase